MDKRYIRFKNIPPDEISTIYRNGEIEIGKECGVSCFECAEINGKYKIVIPELLSGGVQYDIQGFIQDLELGYMSVFLIAGEVAGVGSHGEPCLKKVRIISELKLANKQLVLK